MKTCLYSLLVAALSVSTAFAGGNKEAEKEWLKHAINKETQRAMESQKHHGNTARFEEKFGWLK